MPKRGCLKLWIGNRARRSLHLAPLFAGRGRREAPGEGRGTAQPDQNLVRSEGLNATARPEKASPVFRALPRPSPEASANAPASTSPREERGEVKKLRCV